MCMLRLSVVWFVFCQLLLFTRQTELSKTLAADGDAIYRTVSFTGRHLMRPLNRSMDIGQIWTFARKYICVPLLRVFTVKLQQPLHVGEHVALIGNHPNLGEWEVDRSLQMRSKDSSGLWWYVRVPLCTTKRIRYRYFIYKVDRYGMKRIVWWEPQHYARVMENYHIFRSPLADQFGTVFKSTVGDVERERGWLRNEYQIELKFVWPQHFKWFQRRVRRMRLKLLMLGSEIYHDTDLEVAKYAYKQSHFRSQPINGIVYKPGDVAIFRATVPLQIQNTYKLLVSSMNGSQIGEVLIFPSDLKGSDGVAELAVHFAGDGFHIGWLSVPYLIVRPLSNALELNFRAGFHHYWPMNWPVLDIGHRGSGRSFYQSYAVHFENTIESLQYVGRVEGDMVQLDIQFTRDYVPVLWHDFGFYTTTRQSESYINQTPSNLEYIYIRDLTYKELRRKRVFVMKDARLYDYSHLNVRNKSIMGRLFPKLSDVYDSVSKSIALNVDVKWPQLFNNDEIQAHDSLDKNHAANVMIEITGKLACGRAIIFSSFDVDMCTLLRFKQNVFPVMLTTAGSSFFWQPFKDLRTQSVLQAVNYAEASNILGISAHTNEFLRDEKLVEYVTDLGQVIFVWGDDLLDYKVLKKFRSLGVTGLIYDRIDLYGPTHKRKRFFFATELSEIFQKQCEAIDGISRKSRNPPNYTDGTNMENITSIWRIKMKIKKPKALSLL